MNASLIRRLRARRSRNKNRSFKLPSSRRRRAPLQLERLESRLPFSGMQFYDGSTSSAEGESFVPTTVWDFGDAPPAFITLLSQDGPRHVVGGLHLGTQIDDETNAHISGDAMGDDVNGNDDEDGVTWQTPLVIGGDATAEVVITNQLRGSPDAFLNVWIDFNQDTDWDDAGEQIVVDKMVNAGATAVSFTVPLDAPAGFAFARFRLSTTSGLSYFGPAPDGEVEDYRVLIEPPPRRDYGDAPASYGTLLANDGARHVTLPGLLLGSRVDSEPDGQPSTNATGDDTTNDDDEDGIIFNTTLLAGSTSSLIAIASSAGKLDAWMDFAGDGVFDASDQILTSVDVSAGGNLLNFNIPDVVTQLPTFARFRISSRGGLGPTGEAPDGEVEDYVIQLKSSGSVTVTMPTSVVNVVSDTVNIVLLSETNTVVFAGPLISVDSLILQGNDDDNRVRVHWDSGKPVPQKGMFYHGGTGGNDALEMIGGDFLRAAYGFSADYDGDVMLKSVPDRFGRGFDASIYFTGLESIHSSSSVQDLAFQLPPGMDNVVLHDDVDPFNHYSMLQAASQTFVATTFHNPSQSLTLAARGGDTIHVNAMDQHFAAAVTIRGDASNDTILVDDYMLRGPLHVFGRGGNDRIVVRGTTAPGQSSIPVVVHAGDGDDFIDIQLLQLETAELDVQVDGGGGNDVMSAHVSIGEDVTGDVTSLVAINGGPGVDEILAFMGVDPSPFHGVLSRLHGRMDIRGGGGADQMHLTMRDAFDGRVQVRGGADNDQVTVHFVGSQMQQLHAALDGGNDSLALQATDVQFLDAGIQGHQGHDTIHVMLHDVVSGDINALGGTDDDDMLVSVQGGKNGILKLLLDGDSGNDQLKALITRLLPEISEANSRLDVQLRGGADNDIALVDYLAGGEFNLYVLVDMGTGNDKASMTIDTHIAADKQAQFDIRGGLGNDQLSLRQRGRMDGRFSARLDGGQGQDAVDAVFQLDNRSRGWLDVELFGGDDDDLLSLEIFGDERLAALNALVDGGLGRDRCRATANVRVINCER